MSKPWEARGLGSLVFVGSRLPRATPGLKKKRMIPVNKCDLALLAFTAQGLALPEKA